MKQQLSKLSSKNGGKLTSEDIRAKEKLQKQIKKLEQSLKATQTSRPSKSNKVEKAEVKEVRSHEEGKGKKIDEIV